MVAKALRARASQQRFEARRVGAYDIDGGVVLDAGVKQMEAIADLVEAECCGTPDDSDEKCINCPRSDALAALAKALGVEGS
jgi:hypothetical protein